MPAGPKPIPLIERLERHITRSDGCWEWTAYKDKNGYGRIGVGSALDGTRKVVWVHRAAYEAFVGPIPEAMTIDHLCRNRGCVNPDHLEPVTMLENWLRGESITAQRKRRETCHAGHAYDRTTSRGHRRCTTCDNASARARYARRLA